MTKTIQNNQKINSKDYIIFPKNNLKKGLKLIKETYYNQKTETYGPFEGENAINFLKIIDYEDSIS